MEGLLTDYEERDLIDEFYHERFRSYLRAGLFPDLAGKLASTDTKERIKDGDENSV